MGVKNVGNYTAMYVAHTRERPIAIRVHFDEEKNITKIELDDHRDLVTVHDDHSIALYSNCIAVLHELFKQLEKDGYKLPRLPEETQEDDYEEDEDEWLDDEDT